MPACQAGCSEQKKAAKPAQMVHRRHLGQKKVSFPARNEIPTACRAEKGIISCAEGASEAFEAEKGIISCAERDANRLPSRKMRQFLRGRCSGGIWGKKRYHFLRGMGYLPPSEQKNSPNPAQKALQKHLVLMSTWGALCGCEAAVGLILLGTFAIFALTLCFPA